ncbi:hypothetical protein OSB04_011507 [Centaurea solstitialis]|uniref:Uncharacterized protein n=1 Tax=Centaurea solstitialis TaxID=347529 RepID=A0AA38TH43_9ASTR|nr:hypothetical protein OSB04_011507 [Centaurea solstitialis]
MAGTSRPSSSTYPETRADEAKAEEIIAFIPDIEEFILDRGRVWTNNTTQRDILSLQGELNTSLVLSNVRMKTDIAWRYINGL